MSLAESCPYHGSSLIEDYSSRGHSTPSIYQAEIQEQRCCFCRREEMVGVTVASLCLLAERIPRVFWMSIVYGHPMTWWGWRHQPNGARDKEPSNDALLSTLELWKKSTCRNAIIETEIESNLFAHLRI